MDFKRPPARVLANIVRSIGIEHLKPIAPPPQEALPRWRRIAEGLRHSKTRDAEAIHHHYDVSNTFYEWVLGPSMTYTCACYPHPDASLEEAQENKYRLVFEKLRLKPGDRLLDVGCGWGGMVRYAARHGVKAIGVTLSKEQAAWAQNAIAEQGLTDLAEVRHGDYRDVAESGFDAVSSIGLTEHIGVHNYPAYFGFLQSKMRVGALLLNHCITRPDNRTGAHRRRFHRPLRVPRRGAHRLRPDHQRGAGRRPRGRARGEPAPPLRVDAARLEPQSRRALGRGCRGSRAAHRQGVGSLHGRLHGSVSRPMSFSCTRCWRSSSTTTATTADCRCGRGGLPERASRRRFDGRRVRSAVVRARPLRDRGARFRRCRCLPRPACRPPRRAQPR